MDCATRTALAPLPGTENALLISIVSDRLMDHHRRGRVSAMRSSRR